MKTTIIDPTGGEQTVELRDRGVGRFLVTWEREELGRLETAPRGWRVSRNGRVGFAATIERGLEDLMTWQWEEHMAEVDAELTAFEDAVDELADQIHALAQKEGIPVPELLDTVRRAAIRE